MRKRSSWIVVVVAACGSQKPPAPPAPAERCDPPRPELRTAVPLLAAARVTASSTHGEYGPSYVLGGDPDASWCEGSELATVGESLHLRFDRPLAIHQIAIARPKAIELPRGEHAHVTAASVVTDDARSFALISSPSGAFFANVGGAPVRELEVRIEEVSGRADGIACINRIVVNRAKDQPYELLAGKPEAVDAVVTYVADLHAAFATCDAVRFDQLITFPIARTQNKTTGEVTEAIATGAQLAEGCVANRAGYVPDRTRDGLLAALRFDRPGTASVFAMPVMWDLEQAGACWRLRKIWSY